MTIKIAKKKIMNEMKILNEFSFNINFMLNSVCNLFLENIFPVACDSHFKVPSLMLPILIPLYSSSRLYLYGNFTIVTENFYKNKIVSIAIIRDESSAAYNRKCIFHLKKFKHLFLIHLLY